MQEYMWSEDNLGPLVLYYHHVRHGDSMNLVLRSGSKHLYPLSYLTDSKITDVSMQGPPKTKIHNSRKPVL